MKKPSDSTARARRRARMHHWLVVRETKTCVQVEWMLKNEPNVYFASSAEEALRRAGVKL